MNDKPSPGIEDMFPMYADAAMSSMVFSLFGDSRAQKGGYIAIVSDKKVAKALFVRGGVAMTGNLQGDPIEGALDKFLEETATDPKCIGIVPLTDGVIGSLESLGLKVTHRGIGVAKLDYNPVLYRSK